MSNRVTPSLMPPDDEILNKIRDYRRDLEIRRNYVLEEVKHSNAETQDFIEESDSARSHENLARFRQENLRDADGYTKTADAYQIPLGMLDDFPELTEKGKGDPQEASVCYVDALAEQITYAILFQEEEKAHAMLYAMTQFLKKFPYLIPEVPCEIVAMCIR
jgi:hypothetical protein